MKSYYILPALAFSFVMSGCCNQKPKIVYRCAHGTTGSHRPPAPTPTHVEQNTNAPERVRASHGPAKPVPAKEPVVVAPTPQPEVEKRPAPRVKVLGKPGVKFIRSLGDISMSVNEKISRSDYIANGLGIYFYNKPFVYDINKNKRVALDRLKPLLKKYSNSQLVYFDGKKMEVGIKVSIRTAGDPVVCPCGRMLVPGQTRAFCKACPAGYKRKKSVYKSYYAQFSLKTNALLWRTEIGSGTISSLGPDTGRHNILFVRHEKARSGRTTRYTFTFFKINFGKKRVVWTHKLSSPKRVVIGPYGFNAHASADLQKIFVWEHDEKYNQCTNGCLKNPPARGYIIDVKTKKHVTFRAPLNPYGHIFDTKAEFLYVSSFQKGRLYKVSTKTGKIVKTVPNNPGTFNFGFSPSEKYLYSFHKRGIIVFSTATLKPIQQYPLATLFPGKRFLISVEFYQIFRSGYMAFRNKDTVKIFKLLE